MPRLSGTLPAATDHRARQPPSAKPGSFRPPSGSAEPIAQGCCRQQGLGRGRTGQGGGLVRKRPAPRPGVHGSGTGASQAPWLCWGGPTGKYVLSLRMSRAPSRPATPQEPSRLKESHSAARPGRGRLFRLGGGVRWDGLWRAPLRGVVRGRVEEHRHLPLSAPPCAVGVGVGRRAGCSRGAAAPVCEALREPRR